MKFNRNFLDFLILLAIVVGVFILIISKATADELRIPRSCYPKQIQAEFETRGYKLDLSLTIKQ